MIWLRSNEKSLSMEIMLAAAFGVNVSSTAIIRGTEAGEKQRKDLTKNQGSIQARDLREIQILVELRIHKIKKKIKRINEQLQLVAVDLRSFGKVKKSHSRDFNTLDRACIQTNNKSPQR